TAILRPPKRRWHSSPVRPFFHSLKSPARLIERRCRSHAHIHFPMTEPANQPLLEEQSATTKKPARKRTTTTKTRASTAKAAAKPVAVSPEEAARLDIPRVESFHRAARQPPVERAPRGERPEYAPLAQPEAESAPLPPPREDEIGEAEGIVEVSGKGFGFLRD